MVSLEGGVQLPLVREGIQEFFVFHAGKYPIYPKDGFAGAPTSTFEAIQIKGRIHGLNAYESITPINLFHTGKDNKDHYWQRSVGTKFGAYSMKAHRKKI